MFQDKKLDTRQNFLQANKNNCFENWIIDGATDSNFGFVHVFFSESLSDF